MTTQPNKSSDDKPQKFPDLLDPKQEDLFYKLLNSAAQHYLNLYDSDLDRGLSDSIVPEFSTATADARDRYSLFDQLRIIMTENSEYASRTKNLADEVAALKKQIKDRAKYYEELEEEAQTARTLNDELRAELRHRD